MPHDEAPAHVPSWLGEVARQAAVRGEIVNLHRRKRRDLEPGELDALSLSLRGGLSHEAWVRSIRDQETPGALF